MNVWMVHAESVYYSFASAEQSHELKNNIFPRLK